MKNSRYWTGIRGRLLLAFWSVAAMTVAATVVAWISFGRLGESLDSIVVKNVPAVMLAAYLAEKGGAIIGTAPNLAAAIDEQGRQRAWAALSKNLKEMDALVGRMNARLVGGNTEKALTALIASLVANLRELDTNVRRRLWYQTHKEELTERLRWALADFLDEVEPMIDDTRFNIEVALEQSRETSDAELIQRHQRTLREETNKQRAFYRLNASGNLVAGLIGRASNLPENEALRDTHLYFREVASRLESDLKIIGAVPGALSLRQSLQDILAYAEGENSLFQLREDELKTLEEGQRLLGGNRKLVARLQDLIAGRVQTDNAATLVAADQSRVAIFQGKLFLLIAAGFSLLIAILIVWLYVGRNLVRRITALDRSMRAIADGDLKADVPTGGTDEIADMASALRTFRDTLAETQAELIQAGKLAALGQLSTGIAHELNQPLAAIRHYARNGQTFLVRNRAGDAQANLKKISELTERACGIINHLKSSARKPAVDLERVDLKTVLQDALSLLEGRIKEADADVTVQIDARCRFVIAEPIQLEQVLINLLSNALDAMKGSECRELVISSQRTGKGITMTVTDTGPGIPEPDIDRIFEPFFTTKEVGEGLGLGLTISYNIVKDFGGAMRVTSQPGKGSAFHVTLDCA